MRVEGCKSVSFCAREKNKIAAYRVTSDKAACSAIANHLEKKDVLKDYKLLTKAVT